MTSNSLLPRTITLFEHQTKTYPELHLQPDDRELAQLERLNEQQNAELIAVGRHGITARHYVGILRAGALTFQILPKIDYSRNDERQSGKPAQEPMIASATRNLFHLLAYTHDLTLHQKRAASLRSQPDNWFELLTRLFAEELHRQIKHGIDRTYVNIEGQLPTIRGTWKIEQQIVRPPYALHRFDVSYDEYLPDTALNRVFRFVVEQLLRMSQDQDNRRLLLDLADWMLEVPLLPHVTPQLMDEVQITRLNERFLGSFNLARLFLESLAPHLIAGNRQFFAFMFDMNTLFERFVVSFLRHHQSQIFTAPYENLRIMAQGSGNTLYLAERVPEAKQIFRIKPDIVLATADGAVAAVIDTKYKRLDPNQVRLGLSEADFCQVVAYAGRLVCPRAMLLYPTPAQHSPVQAAFRIQGRDTKIFVATIDLHQPLNQPANLIEQLRYSLNMLLRERI